MKPIIISNVILLLFGFTGVYLQAQEKKNPVGKIAAEPQSVMIGKKISPINYVACLDSDGNATAVVRDEPSEAREQAPGSGFSHMIIGDGSGQISYSTSNIQRNKWSPLKQLILSKDGIHDMSFEYGQSEYGLLMFSTGKKNTRKYFAIPMLDCRGKWGKKVLVTAAGSDDFSRWSTSRADGSIELFWLNNKVFYQKRFSLAGWSKTRRLAFGVNDEKKTRIKFTAFSKNGLAVSWLGEAKKTDNKKTNPQIFVALRENGRWQKPRMISGDIEYESLQNYSVASNGNGDIVFVWNGDLKLIRAKRYSHGRWHETNTLHDDTDKMNYRFNIAIDDKGSIRLVWNEKYGKKMVMFSSFFNAAIKKWSLVPERIDRYLWQDLYPATAGNRSGTVITAWTETPFAARLPSVIYFTSAIDNSRGWHKRIRLSNLKRRSYSSRVAINSQGQAVVLWYTEAQVGNELWARFINKTKSSPVKAELVK